MGLARTALWVFSAACVLSAAQPMEIKTATLANGLKILIHEDHAIPNVALYFFFKIGSRNEGPGTTGISHFFEHMMFNGAKKYGPKQFDIHMEKSGGRNNARTGRDTTVYTDWFPKEALELMFDMEADRIRDLSFDPAMIESERGVVRSERRMTVDNSNSGTLWEQLNATAYTAHSYGWPVIGWPSDIESWTMEDLKRHFRAGYSPSNCVAVVVGDVTAEEVLALARKYLEPIPASEPPLPVRTREPEQQGERRVLVRRPVQLPLQMVSYHVPQANSPEWYPLEVLGSILTGGRSSRLYRRLVDHDQLAVSVTHSHSPSMDPGQFVFTVQPRSGVDPVASERALFEELERIAKEGITAGELRKAKNKLLTDLYRQMKTIAGKADLLGEYEVIFGDYRKLFSAAAELERVSAGDVRAVAERFFKENNRTVATLIPEGAGK